MGKIHDAKLLGGIGAILMLLGGAVIPGIGAIIGLILLFIAVKYISQDTKNDSIFDNYLMHFIFTIIAIVAIFVIFFVSIGGFMFFSAMQKIDVKVPQAVWNFISPYLIWWVLGFIIGWIFFVIGAFYLRKSYNSIAEHTKHDLFKTTATIYLIGAITLIIIVGFIIILIAKIMEIVAYLTLPDQLPISEQVPQVIQS